MVKTLDADPVPADMKIGMEGYILDTAWIWVAKVGDKVNGFLAASPCHGMVLVWRLVLRKESPIDTLPLLLRQFVRDVKKRGFIGLFSYLDPKNEAEKFLMRAIKGMGGEIINKPQFFVAAPLVHLERW